MDIVLLAKPIDPNAAFRALAWKEWREHHGIIYAAMGLETALILLMKVLSVGFLCSFEPIDLGTWTLFLWLFLSLICGSSTVAPEIGNGSLQFLSSLPTGRAQIWWSKIAVGFAVLTASILAASVTGALIWMLFSAYAVGHVIYWFDSDEFISLRTVFAVLLGTIPAFGVGSVITMLTDRPISAVCSSVSIAIIFYAETSMVVDDYASYLPGVYVTTKAMIPFAALTLAFFSLSYRLFTQGETLKTNKRTAILTPYLIPTIVIYGVLMIGSHFVSG